MVFFFQKVRNTVIGGKFKFQAQDSFLEYFYFGDLEIWKTNCTFSPKTRNSKTKIVESEKSWQTEIVLNKKTRNLITKIGLFCILSRDGSSRAQRQPIYISVHRGVYSNISCLFLVIDKKKYLTNWHCAFSSCNLIYDIYAIWSCQI